MKVTIDIPEKTLLRIKSAARHDDNYESEEELILDGIRLVLQASEEDILLKPGRRKIYNACLCKDPERRSLFDQGYIYLGEHHERLGLIEKEMA